MRLSQAVHINMPVKQAIDRYALTPDRCVACGSTSVPGYVVCALCRTALRASHVDTSHWVTGRLLIKLLNRLTD